MKATNSEVKINVQLLICQTNLSPCLRNNVGTKEILPRAMVSNAKQINPNFFIVAVVHLNGSASFSMAFSTSCASKGRRWRTSSGALNDLRKVS